MRDHRNGEKISVTINPALQKVVPGYLENRRRDLKSILQSLSRNDFDTIRSTGHSMKGSGASYGFPDLTEMGRDLEEAAREKNIDRIRSLTKRLHDYLDNVTWSVAPWTPEEGLKPDLQAFKELLAERKNLDSEALDVLMHSNPADLYFASANVGIKTAELAEMIAGYLNLPHVSELKPESMVADILPRPFCRQNSILPVLNDVGETVFALSNPFNYDLMDAIRKYAGPGIQFRLVITEPENIINVLNLSREQVHEGRTLNISSQWGRKLDVPDPDVLASRLEAEIEKHPIVFVTNNLIDTAVQAKASDIHIEPKERETVVRFRIYGELRKMFSLKKSTGTMLVSRFKALGGLDIAEKMRPQDGALEVNVGHRAFKLRLATTSTPYGESLTVRLLDPTVEPADLMDLGLTRSQADTLLGMAQRGRGFILIVGTTGSGKTTTIYSLLSRLDTRSKGLITVEDPVEYKIPDAVQQQINEKAGVTFEAVLKSSVRQDPDILFIGEIRDPFSANIALDFASTGHLTISTLHTSNVTTAVFRLERLGVSRLAMADAIRGIAAQRLLKKLCPHCREIGPISHEERDLLSPYTEDVPEKVARPVGCQECGGRGYKGRRGLFEFMIFDPEISDMIRSNKSISEIRHFMWERGDYLISQHALDGIRDFYFPPRDVYDAVLVEEAPYRRMETAKRIVSSSPVEAPKSAGGPRILVVEDDADIRLVVSEILKREDYDVTTASDGIEALLELGKGSFDLIISDINMPNLDGFKLQEMILQKGFDIPLVFLTAYADEENEMKGLELGAIDYIKKPLQEDILALRVKNILKARGAP